MSSVLEKLQSDEKILFIVIIILTSACSNKDNNKKGITITIKRDQNNHNPIGNSINVTFKNNLNTNSHTWLMSCDYSENFITNNENIILPSLECAKNIPKLFLLKPSEEKIITLYTIYSFGLPEQNLKIGFFDINDLNKYFSTVKEYQKEKNNNKTVKIIWSNQLTL